MCPGIDLLGERHAVLEMRERNLVWEVNFMIRKKKIISSSGALPTPPKEVHDEEPAAKRAKGGGGWTWADVPTDALPDGCTKDTPKLQKQNSITKTVGELKICANLKKGSYWIYGGFAQGMIFLFIVMIVIIWSYSK